MNTLLPENPTKEVLMILADIGVDFHKTMDIAREEQRKLGLDIVPPNCEMELASARYRRLYNHLFTTEE